MSYNLIFKLYKDTISISKMTKEVDKDSLNNTNVIDVKELKFSNDYIKENFELVSNFLNVVIIKQNITNAQINNMDIASLSIELINTWEHIKKISFKPDKTINLDIFLKILDNKYIDTLEVYEMSDYLIERLDINKQIKIITRHKHEFVSKFMNDNLLASYSDIYYKRSIFIKNDFNEREIEAFKNFIALNNRLKHIKIVNYSNELLTTIIEELEKYKKKNILIEIIEKNNDLNMIYNSASYIKRIYHNYFEEYNINFKITYSKEYKTKNFFKELNFKMFTTILLFIIVVGAITLGINYYVQYNDQNKIDNQMEEIDDILDLSEEFIDMDNNELDIEYINKGDGNQTTTKKKSGYVSAYYTNYSNVFEKLKEKNKDTVGWLQVNNTKIKYPVVQAGTNSYYLNHDFNQKKNSMGWIFMDYRNDPVNLDKNTIIYGHNIKQGIMFGTIKNMLNSSWYKKPSNQIITFNTPEKNMKWQIFSLYKVKATEDYLKNDFDSDKDFEKFIKMIKDRSIHDFNIDVTAKNKIITLSTCFNHTNRHVIHAVLIEDDKEETKSSNK